jgi:hypothetical protein
VISDLAELLRSLRPTLHPGVWVFSTLPAGANPRDFECIASFREAEGVSVILSEEAATHAGLPVLFRAAWIALDVHSDLYAVGLTAAVSTALTDAGISCNVVAAARHDHLFVPVEQAQAAMDRLLKLQRES